MEPLIIIGAGGHAKVVYDTIQKQGKYKVIGVCVDDKKIGDIVLDGIEVLSDTSFTNLKPDFNCYYIVAIGNNEVRKLIYNNSKKIFKPATVIHPNTTIAKGVNIKPGSIILPGTVIAPGVEIGENCIINSMVFIDHDSFIKDHEHVLPGSIINSYSRV